MDESTDIATSGAVPQAQKGNNEVSARGNMKEKLWTFGNEGCLTDISLQGMLHRCFQIQATSGLRGCFFITARWDQGFPQEYRSGQPIGKSSQLEGGSGATEENDASESGNLVASPNQYVEPSWTDKHEKPLENQASLLQYVFGDDLCTLNCV